MNDDSQAHRLSLATVTITTDGATRSDPGPGGWAALLEYGTHERLIDGEEPTETTTKVMELVAVAAALEALKRPCHVVLRCDSTYVRDGLICLLDGGALPRTNRAVWERLSAAIGRHTLELGSVKGRTGDQRYERVDAAAHAAANRAYAHVAAQYGSNIGDDTFTHALALLRTALACPQAEFRPGQWEAIEQLVVHRARLLVVERTGWGKSLVYFMATRLLRERGAGPTLLISPLLALMRNQILAADRLGVRAETVNSTNKDDWDQVLARLHANQIDVLLISPERLADETFRERYLLPIAASIGLFVVDEAHCISDWGHDFRPDYRRIVRILQALPSTIPVVATTATANERVVRDVVEQLGTEVQVIRGPLIRTSLSLQNIHLPSQATRLAWLAEHLPQMPGNGIIYALTRKDTEHIAAWLQMQGIAAEAYHADVENDRRVTLEAQLLDNQLKALVATSSLGMGFDKPDMGFVIHFHRPGSVVHYYQQVGRAGRAIEHAYGIMLSGDDDDEILDYFIATAFEPEEHIAAVLAQLEATDHGLKIKELEQGLNLRRSHIKHILKLLSVETPSPVSEQHDGWHLNPINYVPNQERIQRIIRQRREEQQRMYAYLHTHECLMRFLGRELDDPAVSKCGRCASCVGQPLLPTSHSVSLATQAEDFLRHLNQRIEPRKQWPGEALVVPHGWKGNIPVHFQAEEGRTLCLWGDTGWGELVRKGKQRDGRFADELVQGAAELITQRWHPDPMPTWVTCVPSQRHPTLVADFAQRLAQVLRLPFVPVVRRIRPTESQKLMRNSYQQAHNLAGAFTIDAWSHLAKPVLLVDDIVDSGWTFTILAALLREAGSGSVYPFALAQVLADDDERRPSPG
ncbi:RecQ family ATP-dependent DNA helicase [Candidatus Chloroploca sp. M-50]|uniref:DNA 3'-5' helicase n=1 Tax=Candidatus Chloroploca mongolica TaxID=2528176 RepID=A0ABS4D4L1_9CHLR|nr:RecQ family ATP-dependent DNA helicase [Candidatus Chloroploca mongolica]MBP1464380.1 RecQ family ATP-dependent DNA helicase [Candidatus Chloroploca mongolica]